ncbi:putative fluoride ion transporter CrcB [Meiothermus luteus]|jgi:CrcB protein|uniref:Fluoride-specific ion channel FluC n=1 Tax=Meiothermus luteus TaxID=2026184 RepID=A0A399F1P9_9DEIN|nr:putative fluoride ion transporter CrcB [Meiothermus luteus]
MTGAWIKEGFRRILIGVERYLLVALGGAIGALLRYGLGAWVQALSGPGFPWSTFLINITGSFFIGVVLRLSLEGALSPEWRLLLAVGVLGGYTTFSTFSWETLALVQQGEWFKASLYVLGSVVLGFLLVLLAYRLAGRWL